jgi:hypothetical protein
MVHLFLGKLLENKGGSVVDPSKTARKHLVEKIEGTAGNLSELDSHATGQ